jgi:prepilin-type N-terminal cleavage/methylation domain-containing protein
MDSNGITRQTRRARRPAFTLVELLTVITIIGILMGLITGAVIMARAAARRAAIQTEINELGTSLKKYYDQFGDYPPDCTDSTKFIQHMQMAFPRFVITGNSPSAQFSNLANAFKNTLGVNLTSSPGSIDASKALVLFLGGRPVGNITGSASKLIPLSADPTDPFDINYLSSNGASRNLSSLPPRMKPFFDFDETRLFQPTGAANECYQYYPNIGTTAQTPAPYIYFRAMTNGLDPNHANQTAYPIPGYNTNVQYWPQAGSSPWTENGGQANYVLPYYWASNASNIRNWFRPKDFQIISAGLDGQFGLFFSAPLDNVPLSTANQNYVKNANSKGLLISGYDNITNFATSIESVK